MALARFTFKIMLLVALLATAQVFLVRVSDGLLAAAGPGTEKAQTMVLCIMQGTDANICAEGLK